MPELDLSKLSLNLAPTLDIINDIQRDQDNAMRALEATRRAKEQEELRRHNEMVSTLREAGEKGATIIIGDHAGDIQIQQNSAGATQKMEKNEGIDYAQVLGVLIEIKEYFAFPQFEKTFGENTESIKAVIESTIEAVNNKEDEGLIKKSLRIIRDIAVNAAGGVIASGIIALLGSLPIG